MRIQKMAYLILCTAMIASCGKSDDSDDESTSESSGTPSNGTPASEAANPSPDEIMNFIDRAVTSSFASSTDGGIQGMVGGGTSLMLSGDSQSSGEPECSEKGEAWDDSDDSLLLSNEANWGPQSIYCRIAVNSESPGTVQGSYFLTKGIICALNTDGDLNFLANPLTETKSINPTAECFSAEFATNPENTSQFPFDSEVTASLLANDADGYTHKLEFTVPFKQDPYVLKFKSSESAIAAASNEGWAFALDFDQGEVRYETAEYVADNGSGNSDAEHVRLLVKGNINPATGAFIDITSAQGLYSHSSHGVTSISGNAQDGFKAITHSFEGGIDHDNFANWPTAIVECVGDNSPACTGNDGIVFTNDDFIDLAVLDPSVWEELFHERAPLSFTDITTEVFQ